MNEAMQKLVDAIEKASPVLWQAAYRQVYVDGIEYGLTAIVLLMAARWFWAKRKAVLVEDDDATEPLPVGLAVLTVFVCVAAFGFLMGAVDILANPTFAAIKNLRDLV